MSEGPISITSIARHRNGVSGDGFHVVLFDYVMAGVSLPMVGAVFAEPGHVAILCVDALVEKDIAFAGGNSWRGDFFEPDLRNAIAQYEKAR